MSHPFGTEENSSSPSFRESTNPLRLFSGTPSRFPENLLSKGYDEYFDPPLGNKYECSVCLLGLREPVQTPCGHRFCRGCILRSIRWGNTNYAWLNLVHWWLFCRTDVAVSYAYFIIYCFIWSWRIRSLPKYTFERMSRKQLLIHYVDMLTLSDNIWSRGEQIVLFSREENETN